jgi:hypothetical protein
MTTEQWSSFYGTMAQRAAERRLRRTVIFSVNPVSGKHEFIHATSYAKQVVINEMKTYFHWPERARRPVWD